MPSFDIHVVFIVLLASATARAAPLTTPSPQTSPYFLPCFNQGVKAFNLNKGFRLLFLGDSITEGWGQTDQCQPCSRWRGRSSCQGVSAVFTQHYSSLDAGALGIGGDQTANLLWRLQNGQLPRKHKSAVEVVVLLIGTNDLGAAARGLGASAAARALKRAVPGVARRLQQVVGLLRAELPEADIVLMGLLPRGTGSGEGRPLEQNDHRWPSVYADAMQSMNAWLSKYAGRDSKLHFLDCSSRFLTANRKAISRALMPDALHPNAAGYEQLAQCLDPLIARLMS